MSLAEKLGKVGVIFDSGAFYGAFGLGVAKALWEEGIRPVAIGGVSVGALNAAKLAENNSLEGVAELEKIWLEVEKTGPSSVFNVFNAITNKMPWHSDPTSIYGSASLKYLVGKLSPQKIVNSQTLLQVVVMDELNDTFKIISNRDEEIKKQPELIWDGVRASASVGGAFPPVIANGGVNSDGMIFGPLLESFAKYGCDTIFVAMNDQKRVPSYEVESFNIRIFRMMRRLQVRLNEHDIDKFLEKHPDFQPFNYETDDDDPIIWKSLKVMRGWLANAKNVIVDMAEGKFDGIQHQLVFIFPHCRISSLYPTKFKKGDILLAAQKSHEETKRILNKLKNQ